MATRRTDGDDGQPRAGREVLAGRNTSNWGSIEQLLDAEYVWENAAVGRARSRVENNSAMNANYPEQPKVETRRITGSKDEWVTTPTFTVLKITRYG